MTCHLSDGKKSSPLNLRTVTRFLFPMSTQLSSPSVLNITPSTVDCSTASSSEPAACHKGVSTSATSMHERPHEDKRSLTRLFRLLSFLSGLLIIRIEFAFLRWRLLGFGFLGPSFEPGHKFIEPFFLRMSCSFVFPVVLALGHDVEFYSVKRWLRRVGPNK